MISSGFTPREIFISKNGHGKSRARVVRWTRWCLQSCLCKTCRQRYFRLCVTASFRSRLSVVLQWLSEASFLIGSLCVWFIYFRVGFIVWFVYPMCFFLSMIRDLAAVIMLCSFMSTHSGGFLHLIPDHRGEIRNISTPLINANAYKWKCLRFWYYIAIGKGQSLRVEVHSSSRAPMTIFHDSDVTRTFKFVQRPIYDWKALKVSWVRDKWATLHVYRTVTCVLLLSRTALYHNETWLSTSAERNVLEAPPETEGIGCFPRF